MTQQTGARRHAPATALIAIGALLLGGPAAGDAEPSVGAVSADDAREREVLSSLARQTRSGFKREDLVVRIDGHPALCGPNAALTLIEFSDLHCGFCRRHAQSILPVLRERYVETGRLRYVLFDFPVEARHPAAHDAAIAARCADRQNAVAPMRAWLIANRGQLQPDLLCSHVEALGLDGAAFTRCREDGAAAEAVARDLMLGQQLMVLGTPTFLVGYRQGDGGEIRVLRRIVGAQTLDVFETAINGVAAETQAAMARVPTGAVLE